MVGVQAEAHVELAWVVGFVPELLVGFVPELLAPCLVGGGIGSPDVIVVRRESFQGWEGKVSGGNLHTHTHEMKEADLWCRLCWGGGGGSVWVQGKCGQGSLQAHI